MLLFHRPRRALTRLLLAARREAVVTGETSGARLPAGYEVTAVSPS